jgi:hypothetical protein
MTADNCAHCSHYHITVGQLFDTAVALDEAEDKIHRLRPRLNQTADALTWCLARIDPADVPAWVRCALDEALT